MVDVKITSYAYFENGRNGGSVVGSMNNGSLKYVARYGFTIGENGASSVSLSFASGTVEGIWEVPDSGELIAVISTDATAYTNHFGDDITDALAKSAFVKGTHPEFSLGYSCTIEYNFLPNTDYYIFVVPKMADVGVAWAHYNYMSCTASGSASFVVSIIAGAGAIVSVKRNGSSLSDGATITYGDSLIITFAAADGYWLKTHTVNGADFSSGDTHKVTGNVQVDASADILAYPIGNGSGNDLYYAYIGDGAGGGAYYVAYIGTDDGPTLYGSNTQGG